MAKLTGALLSFGARGSVGKTITASKWRGQSYMKQYTVPSNPRSTKQVLVRDIFSALNQFWKLAPAAMVATFAAASKGRTYVDRNLFISKNGKALIDTTTPKTSMAAAVMSPGSGGGSTVLGITPTPGSTNISLALTLPEVPTGWTLVGSRAVAFIDQAPEDPFTQAPVYASEDSTPQTLDVTGLESSQDYVIGVWLEWTKPDGSTAYGVSVNVESSTTA